MSEKENNVEEKNSKREKGFKFFFSNSCFNTVSFSSIPFQIYIFSFLISYKIKN